MYKALIIAVDLYKTGSNLPNTINDANEIKRLLLEEPSVFQEENVQYIHGNLATKAVLDASLNSFLNHAESDDVLFLYWAGHGDLLGDEAFFVPFDSSELIPMEGVRNLIDGTKANTVVSFFDTCHSGAITRKTQKELLRGIEISGEGKILIAACTLEQGAWDRNGHGAFTDYLLQGLTGSAANAQGDIDIYTLYSFISTNLKQEYTDSSQIPVLKSTLTGPPVILKRTTQRNQTISTPSSNTHKVNSSGLHFLLGNFSGVYNECTENDSGIQLILKNVSSVDGQQLKSMRHSEQPFVVHEEAYTSRVNNVDVRSTSEGTVYSIQLQPQHAKNSFFDSNMSYNENGRMVTAEDIIYMRIERILLGTKHSEPYAHSIFNLVETAIMQPHNSAMKVMPNLIEALLAKGLNLQQVRIAAIANLILTNTLEKIEKLEFQVANGDIVNIQLIGFGPKYYANAEATRIEFNQAASIQLGNIIQN